MGPNESRITLTPEQEKHISEIQPEEMKEYLRTIAESQWLIYRDAFDRNVIHEVENPPLTPKGFARHVFIDGKEVLVGAETELALERQTGDVLRSAKAAREEEMRPTRQTTTEAAPSAEEAAARVELELRFKRGEVDTETYLRESGAIASYLADQGVD